MAAGGKLLQALCALPLAAGMALAPWPAPAQAPDGYTIVLVSNPLAISPSLYTKLSYDPQKDFAPISLVATAPNVTVTNPSAPAHTLQEFIALAMSKPGGMNFGSGGAGISNYAAGVVQHRRAG